MALVQKCARFRFFVDFQFAVAEPYLRSTQQVNLFFQAKKLKQFMFVGQLFLINSPLILCSGCMGAFTSTQIANIEGVAAICKSEWVSGLFFV